MDGIERDVMIYLGKAVADAGLDVVLTRESGLIRAGLLDSLALVGLIRFLEVRFGIVIPDGDIDPDVFATPATIIAYVTERLAQTAA